MAEDRATKTILVAEDDPAGQELLKGLLTHHGYEVIMAGDGKEALACLRASPVDLILTDLMMPELGELELIHALRKECPRTPIIVVTGCPKEELVRSVLDAGADEYLVKPFVHSVLMDTVGRELAKAERLSFLMSEESGPDAPLPENPLDGSW